MTHLDCSCSHPPDVPTVTLQHVDTGDHVTVCIHALGAAARLKADAHDLGGQTTLADHGHEYGWGVWRSQHILYLIPPVSPFEGRATDEAVTPMALAGPHDR